MFRGKQRSVCLNLEGSVNKQFSVCALAAIAHRKYVYFLMQRQLRKTAGLLAVAQTCVKHLVVSCNNKCVSDTKIIFFCQRPLFIACVFLSRYVYHKIVQALTDAVINLNDWLMQVPEKYEKQCLMSY